VMPSHAAMYSDDEVRSKRDRMEKEIRENWQKLEPSPGQGPLF
jgi:hypothetical protein